MNAYAAAMAAPAPVWTLVALALAALVAAAAIIAIWGIERPEKAPVNPPAEPAGDVPGPGSPPLAPEEDAGPHARVPGPGPGTHPIGIPGLAGQPGKNAGESAGLVGRHNTASPTIAGPGTRNGPPWEPIVHDPGHDHAPGLWGPDVCHQQVTAAIGGQ